MLRCWPPPLHLVLIGRREPLLPLANLRARGLLAEVRTSDLRFTREEIKSYLALSLPGNTDQALLDGLERATEGWITGLHLVIHRSGATDAPDIGEIGYGRSITNVTHYLFDEVLAAQPEPVRAFLLQTAILDRFNVSLAAAVIGHEEPGCDPHTCIAWIERSDLLVSPQDDRGEWYRCHPLFQKFLLKRMETEYRAEQVSRRHERAASWFAEQGETDEAVHHALAAANLDLAAQGDRTGVMRRR